MIDEITAERRQLASERIEQHQVAVDRMLAGETLERPGGGDYKYGLGHCDISDAVDHHEEAVKLALRGDYHNAGVAFKNAIECVIKRTAELYLDLCIEDELEIVESPL